MKMGHSEFSRIANISAADLDENSECPLFGGNMNQDEKIPNNVNLGEDRRLQRALETWQPNFLQWWMEMGPSDFQARLNLPAHGGFG